MQSAENEFGALHEWINKQSECACRSNGSRSVAASARRKPLGVAFTA